MDAIWDFIKSMTLPMALVAVAAAIFLAGFGYLITSPLGIFVIGVVVVGVLYWYWNRDPKPPAE